MHIVVKKYGQVPKKEKALEKTREVRIGLCCSARMDRTNWQSPLTNQGSDQAK
jgi:hypothetical protein